MRAATNFSWPHAAFGWRRGVAYTVLWTTVVATLENYVPLAFFDPNDMASLALPGLPGWLVAGALVVTFSAFATPRGSNALLVLGTLAVVGSITLLRVAAPYPFVTLQSGWSPVPETNANALYLAWGTLLYGGLFVAAIALAHRSVRTRALLGQAEIARSRSETLFSQAELLTAQGSVDPAFLLRVLDELQRRYASDPAGAERLLDQLVGFLRLAMPGVRSGQSTLGAELAVARGYLQLTAELEPQRPGWFCDIDSELDELPFPSLLLLPLLDQVAAAQLGQAPMHLTVRRTASQATLALQASVRNSWLTEDLRYRLGVGLRTTHGDAQVFEGGGGIAAALRITLPLNQLFPRAEPAQDLHLTPGAP